MLFEHSDTLIKERMGHMNRGVHWEEAVRSHRPDVVVVGTGAHIYGERRGMIPRHTASYLCSP